MTSITPLRYCSFNIRLDTEEDGMDAWPNRHQLTIETIREIEPDIVGLQEPLPHQYDRIQSALDEYTWYGVPRQGSGEGEVAPVGWRSDRFDARLCETRWLAQQWERPTTGWDAMFPRVATRIECFDWENEGQTFSLWNTHFDHRGERARRESARLLADWTTGREPVIVAGDFNAEPDSVPYELLTTDGWIRDCRTHTETSAGPEETHHQFDGAGTEVIDHIFVSSDIEVKRFTTVTSNDDGRYPSDHFPIVTDLLVRDLDE